MEEERDFMADNNLVEMPQGIQSGRCQQEVEKSAIELLAARLSFVYFVLIIINKYTKMPYISLLCSCI